MDEKPRARKAKKQPEQTINADKAIINQHFYQNQEQPQISQLHRDVADTTYRNWQKRQEYLATIYLLSETEGLKPSEQLKLLTGAFSASIKHDEATAKLVATGIFDLPKETDEESDEHHKQLRAYAERSAQRKLLPEQIEGEIVVG